MNYEQKYNDALDAAKHIYDDMKSGGNFGGMEDLEVIFPELAESEDERIRKVLIDALKVSETIGELKFRLPYPTREECIAYLEKQKEQKPTERATMQDFNYHEGEPDKKAWSRLIAILNYAEATSDDTPGEEVQALINWIDEKRKEQKPIIQDVELNDAVYDYVRDHFIAGADFTPEYIKKLMENAFFAGVDYYLLKQESESCEPDTNVEKVIEDVIRVYGKTQGEWVGGYDVDTLIVNLRRAFNKKEQKPVDNVSKEEYVKRFKALCDAYEIKLPNREYDIYHLCDDLSKLSIDSSEQKPAEWSEEDEKMLSNLITHIKVAYGPCDWLTETIAWLKSLRPQPKPTEDELEKKFYEEYWKGCQDGWDDYMKASSYRYDNFHNLVPCYAPGGICTNPQMDCINCPRQNSGGVITKPNTSCEK